MQTLMTSKINETKTIQQVVNFLRKKFPRKNASKWDNTRLINAKFKNQQLKNISVGLDIKKDDLEKILMTNTNLVVTHHPLWINSEDIDNGVKHIRQFLIKNKIVFLPLHTPFDISSEGTNFQIIKQLGICDTNTIKQQGYLTYANLITPTDISHLAEIIKSKFNTQCKWRICKPLSQIKRFAICAGGGYSLVKNVDWQQSEIFITGDLKYHDWIDVERNGYNVIDIGHEVENIFTDFITNLLEEKFAIKVCQIKNQKLFTTI